MLELDDKDSPHMEGCEKLLFILSSAGNDHNAPIIRLRQDDTKMAFFSLQGNFYLVW